MLGDTVTTVVLALDGGRWVDMVVTIVVMSLLLVIGVRDGIQR